MRHARKSVLTLGLGIALVVPISGFGVATAQPDATQASSPTTQQRQTERLDRGLIAVPTDDGVLVSWRLLGSDGPRIGFDLYRDGQRLNRGTIRDSTNFLDVEGSAESEYRLVPRGATDAGTQPETTTPWAEHYLDVPLDRPEGGTTPDGVAYEYRANDASVGDLDGDGRYEIILKWDPTNSKDNSQSGHTGEVFIDAYTLTGEQLWRIGLGRNVRAGAHYTQLMVFDLDGDGRSEVAVKTADGSVDAAGTVIGDPDADYRTEDGYILTGPEYLTVFDGATGTAMATQDFSPERGDICQWGDCYGNRGDRFLAGVAYLDGERPSVVFSRGYYEKTMLTAYDWRDGELTQRWTFDSDTPGNEGYAQQGNHNLSIGDVDEDGRDEIIFGAMAVDDDGTGLYTTGLGHGDAMHLSDFDPGRPGLEVFSVHESASSALGVEFRDAASGEAVWGVHTGRDTGRGLAADIDPRHPGAESWAIDDAWNSRTGWLHTAQGELISQTIPAANAAVWWDGDLGREILDHDFTEEGRTGVGRIDKWDPESETTTNLLLPTGTRSNNDTKGNPTLQADILGDWREEVLWPTTDSSALRIFTTPHPTEHRLTTLMHDPIYRLGVAWQNVAYNQPPHTSYFLGYDMDVPAQPSIYYP